MHESPTYSPSILSRPTVPNLRDNQDSFWPTETQHQHNCARTRPKCIQCDNVIPPAPNREPPCLVLSRNHLMISSFIRVCVSFSLSLSPLPLTVAFFEISHVAASWIIVIEKQHRAHLAPTQFAVHFHRRRSTQSVIPPHVLNTHVPLAEESRTRASAQSVTFNSIFLGTQGLNERLINFAQIHTREKKESMRAECLAWYGTLKTTHPR